MSDYQTSETISKLAAALAKAQAKIEPASKDAKNPHFGSRYADLAAVLDVCREPLAEQGLSVVQAPSTDGKRVQMRTVLLHESGEWIAATLTLTAADERPQAVGSAITYARRYALQSMLRIAAEDDDGEGGEGRGRAQGKAQPPLRSEPPPAKMKPPGVSLKDIPGMIEAATSLDQLDDLGIRVDRAPISDEKKDTLAGLIRKRREALNA